MSFAMPIRSGRGSLALKSPPFLKTKPSNKSHRVCAHALVFIGCVLATGGASYGQPAAQKAANPAGRHYTFLSDCT